MNWLTRSTSPVANSVRTQFSAYEWHKRMGKEGTEGENENDSHQVRVIWSKRTRDCAGLPSLRVLSFGGGTRAVDKSEEWVGGDAGRQKKVRIPLSSFTLCFQGLPSSPSKNFTGTPNMGLSRIVNLHDCALARSHTRESIISRRQSILQESVCTRITVR